MKHPMTIHCPDCGSASCRTVAAAYMSGTRYSRRDFGGVGVSMYGNVGVFGGASSGTSSSIFAMACEPPTRPERASLIGIVFTFLCAGFMAGCVAMILLAIAALILCRDDAHTPFTLMRMLSIFAGIYAGNWLIARGPLRRYGKSYAALVSAYEKASATYDRLWVCSKCLHVWHRDTAINDTTI